MSLEDHSFGSLAQWVTGGLIAVIAWLMDRFTGRHIASMDRLTQRFDNLAEDVATMKGDIKVLVEHGKRTDDRLDSLENKAVGK